MSLTLPARPQPPWPKKQIVDLLQYLNEAYFWPSITWLCVRQAFFTLQVCPLAFQSLWTTNIYSYSFSLTPSIFCILFSSMPFLARTPWLDLVLVPEHNETDHYSPPYRTTLSPFASIAAATSPWRSHLGAPGTRS